MEKSLCAYGLGLFINWGMKLVNLELSPAPKVQDEASRARHEWEDHQKSCPACKVIDLEKTNEP